MRRQTRRGHPVRRTCMLSPLGTCAAELTAVVSVAASPNAIAGLKPEPVPAVAVVGPGVGSRANARMIDSGSQFAVGWRAPTSASRQAAVGRCLGSLARQRSPAGQTNRQARCPSGPASRLTG